MHCSICETYLVKWIYIDLWSIGGGGPWYMCILLYVKLLWCSGTTQIYGQLEKGGLGICAFFYMLNLFGVVVLHRLMVNWRMGVNLHTCIVLYVKLFWCSCITQMYCQLEKGPWYMCILVYVRSYIVQQYSIDLWSIDGGYIWILVYVHSAICEYLFGVLVFHRSLVNWRRRSLGICAFFYM